MAHLPEFTYAAWCERIRLTLECTAAAQGCTDPEELAQQAIIRGLEILYKGSKDDRGRFTPPDPSKFNADTGYDGLAKWLTSIMKWNALQWHRERILNASRIEPLDEETRQLARWEDWLNGQPDPDLLEEAMLRLQYAYLTKPQEEALATLIQGWDLEKSAKRLGCAARTVQWRRQQAIQRLLQVDLLSMEMELHEKELKRNGSKRLKSKYWLGGFTVSNYHAPEKLGAKLWRERYAALK